MNAKTVFYIDNEKSEMYKNSVLLSSKKLFQLPTFKELRQMIFNDQVYKIFVCDYNDGTRSKLKLLSKEEVKANWHTQYKSNISLEKKVYLEGFPKEYCYLVELWKMENENPILVLYLIH
ncbi:hypothetical protein [Peribacillus sp. SCS-37]|uniref:hypothetical protein n=1 Tax=Paraperibacillus esterisolvens TaxID=3115296 RepID=UPI003905DAA5